MRKAQELAMLGRAPEVPGVESVVALTEVAVTDKWRDSTGGSRAGTVGMRTGMERAAPGRDTGSGLCSPTLEGEL